MRIVAVSDTHNHPYQTPAADILLHAGDLTVGGSFLEMQAAITQLAKQPATHKVVVAGNHDRFCQDYTEEARDLFSEAGIHYLQDEEKVVAGLRIYGSPYTLEYGHYAFMLPRVGSEGVKKWEQVPSGIDILVTHGPPWGRFDGPFGHYNRVGDANLMRELQRIKPKVHVFGHVHSPGDVVGADGIRYINAAQCSIEGARYISKYEPVVFDL